MLFRSQDGKVTLDDPVGKYLPELTRANEVTVRQVLPNGDLVVHGEQSLTVNKEQHKVALDGRVRPQDVGGDNTVLSTRLADAHIEDLGDGDLSDRQTRAWWRQVLDLLGL